MLLKVSIVSYLSGNLGQALFIRSCHQDVIFTRKSHNCAGTAFVQGDSVSGSKLTEQTLPTVQLCRTYYLLTEFAFLIVKC